MRGLLLFVFLLMVTENSFSQADYIYNKWIAVGESDCQDSSVSKIAEPLKWSIRFNYDQTATITTRQVTQLSVQDFSMDGKRIKTKYRDLLITEHKNDSLWLEEARGDNCVKYLMVSKDLIQKNQRQKVILNDGDSIYFPEFGNSPELENYTDYEQYFYANISKEMRRVVGPVQINLSFVVDKSGELTNVKIITNKEKAEDKIEKILSQTENKWTPMFLGNEPVNSYVQIKFKYQYQ